MRLALGLLLSSGRMKAHAAKASGSACLLGLRWSFQPWPAIGRRAAERFPRITPRRREFLVKLIWDLRLHQSREFVYSGQFAELAAEKKRGKVGRNGKSGRAVTSGSTNLLPRYVMSAYRYGKRTPLLSLLFPAGKEKKRQATCPGASMGPLTKARWRSYFTELRLHPNKLCTDFSGLTKVIALPEAFSAGSPRPNQRQDTPHRSESRSCSAIKQNDK